MAIDLEKNWNWRKSKDIFFGDLVRRYLCETNGVEPKVDQINAFFDNIFTSKDSIINILNEVDAQEALKAMDQKIIKIWGLISDIEKVPEDVLSLSRDLYFPEETPIDLDSCLYSNWLFRAKTTKNFRNHKKINPDYWTAINMQFAINQVAYLMGGMEYNKVGRLKEYIDKAERLELFIWENMSRFVKYAPKKDDYYIEWSMLSSRNLSKSDERWVFATIVFKLVNDKWEIFNYSQVHFYDRQWIEYRTISKIFSDNL